MARFMFFIALFIFAALWTRAVGADGEDLHAMIDEALSNNPEIGAALWKMEMTDQWVPEAGALDDPEVTFKLMEIPGLNFNKAMYANVGIEQMIPYPSKISTKKEIAFLQSEHAHHEHAETILEILTQLKSNYAMLWFSRTSLQLNRENQKLLKQVLQVAQTQYSVGKATQQEVLRASIELDRLKTDEEALIADGASTEAMLKSTLNRQQEASIGSIELQPFSPVQFSYGELLSFARLHRPMIIHDSLSATESNLRVSLMKQEYIPDFRVSLEYVTYPGFPKSTWTAMAGISIPFAPWTLGKASARIQEATAERSMRQSMLVATENMVSSLVRQAYANVKALEAKVVSFNATILPETEQALHASLADYQTERTSFLMLLDTYRMYQEVKMESAMTRMKYEQAVAALEHQVGVVHLYDITLSSQEN